MAQMSRDAWAALADVPDDAALVLAGFSMGGYVAIQMLADAPRRVQALALVDTACRPEPADNVASREKTMAALQADFEGAALDLLRCGLHPDHLSNQALLDEGRASCARSAQQPGCDQLRAIVERADHRALLAAAGRAGAGAVRARRPGHAAAAVARLCGADAGCRTGDRRRRRALDAAGAARRSGRGAARRCWRGRAKRGAGC